MNNPELIYKALHIAAKQHSSQLRKADNSPYINHIIEILYFIVNIGKIQNPSILAAAALHDVLEDTDMSSDTIKKEFGDKVLQIVLELTDDKTKDLSERRTHIVKTIAHKSKEAQIIKIADLLSNLRLIPSKWDMVRKRKYIEWIGAVAGQFEDINQPLENTLRSLLKEQKSSFL